MLERLAGGEIHEGDEVSGEYEAPGITTIRDRQTGSVLRVFVSAYGMTEAAAASQIAGRCLSPRRPG